MIIPEPLIVRGTEGPFTYKFVHPNIEDFLADKDEDGAIFGPYIWSKFEYESKKVESVSFVDPDEFISMTMHQLFELVSSIKATLGEDFWIPTEEVGQFGWTTFGKWIGEWILKDGVTVNQGDDIFLIETYEGDALATEGYSFIRV